MAVYNVFLDTIVKEAREGFVEGVSLGNEIVDVLLFADAEVMKVGKGKEHCRVEVGDRRLESVEVVKYLGVMISEDGRMEEEIRSRIGKAARIIGVLNELVWKQKELSRRTKAESIQYHRSTHIGVWK